MSMGKYKVLKSLGKNEKKQFGQKKSPSKHKKTRSRTRVESCRIAEVVTIHTFQGKKLIDSKIEFGGVECEN